MKAWAVGLAFAGMAFGAAALYHEPYRLQYHFSPAKTWMNDPNGLVWYKGEYHLFFQNNPFGSKPGHLSWGHAVSTDLVHWKELAVAIPEENGIMIFSGSAVVDRSNSSGFCKSAEPADPSCLVAIYTGHTETLQTQNIAYSNDRGRTWTKYAGNPVIDLHMKDFRDPKVSWHEGTKSWVMTVSLPNEHRVRFFASKNLKQWTALSDFGPAGATGGQWECPDLLPIGNKWVLIVNVNPGAVQGGSATQYFVGQFDGKRFENANTQDRTMWADWGKDFYAAVTYFNGPPGDNRRILQGWFGNWEYAANEPTAPQRGAMALPRELTLAGNELVEKPVRELTSLRGAELQTGAVSIEQANQQITARGFRGHEMEIEAEFAPGDAQEFGLEVHAGEDERTIVGVAKDGVFVDRTKSGDVSFSPKFPGRVTAPYKIAGHVKLHLFCDRSSVEVFVDDGVRVISERVFPSAASNGIRLFSNGGKAKVASLHMWKLKSIWE